MRVASQLLIIITTVYGLFMDIFSAPLCSTAGMEYEASIGANFAIYCDVSSPATLNTILAGVDREYKVEIGYLILILKDSMVVYAI